LKPCSDAISIEPNESISYSDILKVVTRLQNVTLNSVGENVRRVRKTAKGDLLLELKEPSGPIICKSQFDVALSDTSIKRLRSSYGGT